MRDAKFDTLSKLYRVAEFTGQHEATLALINQEIVDALTICLADQHEYAVFLDADTATFTVGERIQLTFNTPRIGLGILTQDLQELLRRGKYRTQEPENYFLLDKKFDNHDADVPDDVAKYRCLLRFVELLRRAAAFLDSDDGELIFVNGGKFRLPLNYTVTDFDSIDYPSLDKLLTFIGDSDDAHTDKKLGILEGAVRSLLDDCPEEERFIHLLRNLSLLATNVNEGYRLFIADFSYDKVRDATEAAKIELAGKIHKTFSDIQTQILGIPVATIIVATQMKDAKTIGYEFWVNLAVYVGCWVFAVLVGFVLWNQKHTLAVLTEEIRRQETQISAKYKAISGQFEPVFRFLHHRLCLQRCALFVVGGVLALGVVLATVVFIKVTVPVQMLISSVHAPTLSTEGNSSPEKVTPTTPASAASPRPASGPAGTTGSTSANT